MIGRQSSPASGFRLGRICWAAPYSLLGLTLGSLSLLGGGGVQRRGDVLEFYGHALARILDLLPVRDVLALTLGHTVIARDRVALDVTREHERVHVRQYELWGPLMGPAYLLCSLVLWCQGRDAYRDNPFEREAFGDS